MQDHILFNTEEVQTSKLQIVVINPHTHQSFLNDVLECFSKPSPNKSLPYFWLYDKIGSEIFEGGVLTNKHISIFFRNNKHP